MSDEAVFTIEPNERVLHIVIQHRTLNEISTQELVDGVLTAAAETLRIPIVLDLTRVKFAPSVALGSLVQLSNSFRFDKRRVALIGIGRRLFDTIHVTRLDRVLEIHNSLEKVLEST